MAWLKVDDGFHDHPKVDELSLEAVGLWLLCATWCSRHLTDGEVPAGRVRRLGGTEELCSELVRANMWRTSDDVREGCSPNSYFFINWSDWNPTNEHVQKEREKARVRMQNRRNGTPDQGKRSREHSPNIARTSDDVRDPVPSRPVPIYTSTDEQHFESFWEVYPRRIAKKEAMKKFARAVKDGADPQKIITAATTYATTQKGKEQKYIAHPTTWLNQGRWDDEPELPVVMSDSEAADRLRNPWKYT